MRVVYALVALLAATAAHAQPVGFQIKADVSLGQKPQLRVRAQAKVTELRVELRRDDGKAFAMTRAALGAGETVTFDIGDGAAGRAKYTGTLSATAGGKRLSRKLEFETFVRGKLKVTYDYEHLALDQCLLQFKLSQPPAKAELVVIGEDGKQLGDGAASYQGERADTWVAIKWRQPLGKRVMKMRLRVVAQSGLSTTVELIPWSVSIEHQEVNFATGSAVVERSEYSKLDDSLVKINDVLQRSGRFMKLKLYVAGHTDTVGSAKKNRRLSHDRARAIARYFRKKGLSIAIATAGFGEQVLEVKTPDETDNAANRRVDYVLGPAGGVPPFRGPYLKVRAGWKNVR